METVLVCNFCRAETRLDGHITQQLDAMVFCNDHQDHTEGHGFSVLLPLARFEGVVAVRSLLAGAPTSQLVSDGGLGLTVHASLDDMSSLCGQIGAGSLLHFNQLTWGDVPNQDRCPACNALT